MLTAIFTKGDNFCDFLFASCTNCCFKIELTFHEKGGKNENDKSCFPESVPIYLNLKCFQ